MTSAQDKAPIQASEADYPGELLLGEPGQPTWDQAGVAVISLWLVAHRWIHRRSETLELRSATVGTRDLEIALTVPRVAPIITLDQGNECCLPIALLRKRKVNLFNVRDNDGRKLPLLTRETRGELAARGLIAQARTLVRRGLGRDLPTDVVNDLRDLACCGPADAVHALWRLEGHHQGQTPLSAACRALLMSFGPFRLLAWNLTLNSMVLVRLPYAPGAYHALSARYEEPLLEVPPGKLPWRLGRRAARTAAIAPKKLWFPARTLPAPSSNHYRVNAPEGLQISTATLAVREIARISPEVAPHPQSTVQEAAGVDDRDWEERDRSTGGLTTAHLYDRKLPGHSVALVRANLRPIPGGLQRAIWLTAGLAVILLLATWCALDRLHQEQSEGVAQGASALLLLIPTLLAAYAARPGEHTLTTELVFGLRLLGMGAGATTLAGAGLLVLTEPEADIATAWAWLFGLALGIWLLLSSALLVNSLLRRPELTISDEDSRLRSSLFRAWNKTRRFLQ